MGGRSGLGTLEPKELYREKQKCFNRISSLCYYVRTKNYAFKAYKT